MRSIGSFATNHVDFSACKVIFPNYQYFDYSIFGTGPLLANTSRPNGSNDTARWVARPKKVYSLMIYNTTYTYKIVQSTRSFSSIHLQKIVP
jgi:hypothetical protein